MDWESYPVGLKVLAVDDDPLCLKVVERMLKRCRYDVYTAENGREALAKLRDKDSQIDLVLSDVYMPDMDGFRLLETIALELDVPVIMMSSNGETPVVLRGVTHGAVDFLIKPVRIEELRNVWQHVVRRKSHQGLNSREYSGDDGEMVDGNRADKKRKESPAQLHHETEDTSSAKKPRVVWSVEMHQQFVNAVNSLGIDKAVPKRILDQMNVEGLTRENVASHLQKYRLYLKRVSGVQTSSGGGGRGKAPSEMGMGMAGLEGQAYPGRMMGSHMGGVMGGQGLEVGGMGSVDAMGDQEELKLQLQMRHMQMEQASRAERALKDEAAMPSSALPYKVEPTLGAGGLAGGLAGPSYPLGQPLGSMHAALPMESLPQAAVGAGLPHTPTFDTNNLSYPQQAYPAPGLHGIPSGGLMFPEAHLPQSMAPSMQHNLSEDYLLEGYGDGGEGLANGQSEQDMEKFINTFLQPSD